MVVKWRSLLKIKAITSLLLLLQHYYYSIGVNGQLSALHSWSVANEGLPEEQFELPNDHFHAHVMLQSFAKTKLNFSVKKRTPMKCTQSAQMFPPDLDLFLAINIASYSV